MEIFRQITANNIALKDYPFLKELAMEAYLMENEDILKLDTENYAEVTLSFLQSIINLFWQAWHSIVIKNGEWEENVNRMNLDSLTPKRTLN